MNRKKPWNPVQTHQRQHQINTGSNIKCQGCRSFVHNVSLSKQSSSNFNSRKLPFAACLKQSFRLSNSTTGSPLSLHIIFRASLNRSWWFASATRLSNEAIARRGVKVIPGVLSPASSRGEDRPEPGAVEGWVSLWIWFSIPRSQASPNKSLCLMGFSGALGQGWTITWSRSCC